MACLPGYNSQDGWPVIRSFLVFCIAALLLTSCGQTPSLWGTYPTPTSEAPLVLPSPLPTSTATASPRPTQLPTRTFTPTPTFLPTESPTSSTPAQGTPATPRVETTTTPTFDVAAQLYYAQSGDTVPALALRFGIEPSEIRSNTPIPEGGLIAPGTLLI